MLDGHGAEGHPVPGADATAVPGALLKGSRAQGFLSRLAHHGAGGEAPGLPPASRASPPPGAGRFKASHGS